MRPVIGLLVGMLMAAAVSAETYLSEAQAVKIALPTAESVAKEDRRLTDDQRATLQRTSGQRFPEPAYACFVGRDRADRLVGYAIIMNEIGKEEHITFIVGVTPAHGVSDVAIIEFRESRGSEVRETRFLRQYRHKKSSDPIQVNRDIVNYAGATLSANAVSRGVKKALLLTDLFYPVQR